MFHRTVLVLVNPDGVELSPVLSFIGAFQECALLDAGIDSFRIVRIEGDEFCVSNVRRSGKRPLRGRGHSAERGNLAPVVPQVFSDEKMRRLGSGVNSYLAVDNGRRQAIDVVDRHAVIAALPGFSAVRTRVDGSEKGAGEHDAAGGLENDRTDVLTFQCALSFAPLTLARALEENQPVLGCRPKVGAGVR